MEEIFRVEDIIHDIDNKVFIMHRNKIATGNVYAISITELGIYVKIALDGLDTNVRKNQKSVYLTRDELIEDI